MARLGLAVREEKQKNNVHDAINFRMSYLPQEKLREKLFVSEVKVQWKIVGALKKFHLQR
jgi:hypothetical protein